MAKPEPDDTPPVENPPNEPPKDEPPAPPENPTPPPEKVAEDNGEKVPEWGKSLIQSVSNLTEAVTSALTPDLDDKPTPTPWHKRGLRK